MEPIPQIRTLPRVAYHGARRLAHSFRSVFERDHFGLNWREAIRLEYSPRFSHTHAPLLGKRIALTDPYWYLFCYDEIFKDEIYKFKTDSAAPFIIDCGANIGLSVIYFKHLYPNARIVAFEPDEEIFEVLKLNVDTYEFKDVSLHSAAVWNSEGELSFQPDGSVGGRLWEGEGAKRVKTVRLKDFLNQKVDFLKIDIEGAELEVLRDCEEALANVDYLICRASRNAGWRKLVGRDSANPAQRRLSLSSQGSVARQASVHANGAKRLLTAIEYLRVQEFGLATAWE